MRKCSEILMYWLVLNCIIWKDDLVVFSVKDLICMNLNLQC